MNIETLRKTAPPLKQAKEIQLIDPSHFVLDNGIEVYCLDGGGQDVLLLDLAFVAGTALGKKPLAAHFTNKCLKEGTLSFSSRQIAETLDYYGAVLNNTTTRDDARISLFCLNKHLEALLPVFAEVVLSPVFPEAEVKTIVEKSKQEFLVESEKVRTLARRKFTETVFGNGHPYGKNATADDYDRMDSRWLGGFYAKFYQKAKFRIIAAGRIPKNIHSLLNKAFGQHEVSFNKPVLDFPQHETPVVEKLRFVEKSDSLQSGLAIGRRMFNLHHPDFIKMQVVNTIFGGYFGSRLMTNIREDKGYTYGIHSMLISMQQAGLLQIATQVGTEVTKQAMDEVFIEMERMRNEPVPAAELELVKNYLLGMFMQHADGAISQAQLLRSALDYQNDMSYYQRYLHTIKSITIEEIQDLAVKYLQPEEMIKVVVGKEF